MAKQQETEVKYLGACMCHLISCTQAGHGVIVGFSIQGEEYYCLMMGKQFAMLVMLK
jgi:hypothetical protein